MTERESLDIEPEIERIKRYLEHVLYEFEMFYKSYYYFERITDSSAFEYKMSTECYLLHFRNIIEFFNKPHNNICVCDVLTDDCLKKCDLFFPPEIPFVVVEEDGTKQDTGIRLKPKRLINKGLSHLTKERTSKTLLSHRVVIQYLMIETVSDYVRRFLELIDDPNNVREPHCQELLTARIQEYKQQVYELIPQPQSSY